MHIQELFRDNIHRDIKGVITVGKESEADIQKELQEYVVTRELDKHFKDFVTAFSKPATDSASIRGATISTSIMTSSHAPSPNPAS